MILIRCIVSFMNIEISKQEQADQQRVAIFKALADANRLRIIRVLYQAQREMTCSEVRAQSVSYTHLTLPTTERV